MMVPGMGIHVGSGLIGALLVTVSIVLFVAGYIPWLRRRIEDIFIPGKHLFAAKEAYSGTVTFLRWSAFLFGICLIVPTFVVIDIVLAAVAIWLWRYLVRRAHAVMSGQTI